MYVITLGMLGVLACEGCAALGLGQQDIPVAERRASGTDTREAPVQHTAINGRLHDEPERIAPLTTASPYGTPIDLDQPVVAYDATAPLTFSAEPGTDTTRRLTLLSRDDDALTLSLMTGFDGSLLSEDDWTATPVLRSLQGQVEAQRLTPGRYGEREAFGAEFAFAAPRELTGFGFDIGLVPRASYAAEGDFSVRRIGAEFRLGQDIDQRGNRGGLPSWYLFAGADGEAVIFNNGSASSGLGLVNGLELRDQVTVGDIQAGINVKRFGTNFSLSYIRREVEFDFNDSESIKRNEDFGGITLSWRR